MFEEMAEGVGGQVGLVMELEEGSHVGSRSEQLLDVPSAMLDRSRASTYSVRIFTQGSKTEMASKVRR